MVDYSKGKIYKITSENYNKFYIGSTCRTLKERFKVHKSKMNSYIKNPSTGYCCSYELCEEPDCKIELIKDYPCSCKKELLREEGRLQLLYKDKIVNEQIAGRTQKEWKKSEKGKASQKKWNMTEKAKAHRTKYNQSKKGRAQRIIASTKWKKKRIKCSVCNKEMNQGSLRTHIITQHTNN